MNNQYKLMVVQKVVDIGDKIKFAHILNGSIKNDSDQAITGNQLHQLGSTILKLTVNNDTSCYT